MQNLPLSHSSDTDNSAILVLVISLCDAKNNTTSRFSFLIGTISSKHQKGVATKKIKKNKQKINELLHLQEKLLKCLFCFYYFIF